jgi:hypothetical protein
MRGGRGGRGQRGRGGRKGQSREQREVAAKKWQEEIHQHLMSYTEKLFCKSVSVAQHFYPPPSALLSLLLTSKKNNKSNASATASATDEKSQQEEIRRHLIAYTEKVLSKAIVVVQHLYPPPVALLSLFITNKDRATKTELRQGNTTTTTTTELDNKGPSSSDGNKRRLWKPGDGEKTSQFSLTQENSLAISNMAEMCNNDDDDDDKNTDDEKAHDPYDSDFAPRGDSYNIDGYKVLSKNVKESDESYLIQDKHGRVTESIGLCANPDAEARDKMITEVETALLDQETAEDRDFIDNEPQPDDHPDDPNSESDSDSDSTKKNKIKTKKTVKRKRPKKHTVPKKQVVKSDSDSDNEKYPEDSRGADSPIGNPTTTTTGTANANANATVPPATFKPTSGFKRLKRLADTAGTFGTDEKNATDLLLLPLASANVPTTNTLSLTLRSEPTPNNNIHHTTPEIKNLK